MAAEGSVKARKLEELEGAVSVAINVALWLVKLVLGYLFASLALVADAWHTLSDAVSSVVVVAAARIALKPPDAEHPYGHGKAVHIASMLVGILLLAAAYHVGSEALIRLGGPEVKGLFLEASLVLAASAALKAGLGAWSYKKYRETSSQLLRADAMHHFSDAATSIMAAAGDAIAALGFHFIDSIVALVMVAILAYTGAEITWKSSQMLMDVVPRDVVEKARTVASRVPGVYKVHGVRARDYGGAYYVEMNVHVEPNMSVAEAHRLAHVIEEEVKRKVPGVVQVVVHVEPAWGVRRLRGRVPRNPHR